MLYLPVLLYFSLQSLIFNQKCSNQSYLRRKYNNTMNVCAKFVVVHSLDIIQSHKKGCPFQKKRKKQQCLVLSILNTTILRHHSSLQLIHPLKYYPLSQVYVIDPSLSGAVYLCITALHSQCPMPSGHALQRNPSTLYMH